MLARRAGFVDNHKRIERIYRGAALQVRKRVRRKLALGRSPRSTNGPWFRISDGRWTSSADRLWSNRRYRILVVGDDCTRVNLALEADFAFSGVRMTRTLDAIATTRGSYPETIVLDNRGRNDFSGYAALGG